ncbi:methyltransferase domain-containing protein [Candidatus Poribacteria bacterium]|nr:methyltransferase domain-containing protein [Candidatus Poribacteria bacterium]
MIHKNIINTYSDLARSGKFPDDTYLHRDLLKLIKDRVGNTDRLNILDVGSGAGYFGLNLTQMEHNVTMIDPSYSALRLAGKRVKYSNINSKVNIVVGDGEMLPFTKDKFDIIVCIFVFSHLESPSKALSEIARVLCKNSKALISFENKLWHVISNSLKEDYKQAFSLLLKDKPAIKAYDILPPVKLYTLSEIQEMCNSCGLDIISVSGLRYLTAFQEVLKGIGTTDAEKILISDKNAGDLEKILSDNKDFLQIARHFLVECSPV